MSKRTVVFISGFLSPPNWISHPVGSVPDDVELIYVNPSSVGSLHDRACQVFYELMGGTIDYGEEHSKFHSHAQFGTHFPVGKCLQWNAENPIQIIGHSFGGLTAWVLQNYLAQKRFPGYDTSELWISSIVTVGAPFNGVTQAYEKGLHHNFNPLVGLWSPGYPCGLYSNILEFIDSDLLRRYADVGQKHWLVSHLCPGSWAALIHVLLGFGIHCSTDNISYDSSIRSRLAWSTELVSFDNTYYCSIVGRKDYHSGGLLNWVYCRVLGGAFGHSSERHATHDRNYFARCNKHHHDSHVIDGVDVSCYRLCGNDLLMSTFTQEYPRMSELVCRGCKSKSSSSSSSPTYADVYADRVLEHRKQLHSAPLTPSTCSEGLSSGCWHYFHRDMSHLTVSFQDEETWRCIWETSETLHQQHLKSRKRRNVSVSGGIKRSDCDMQRVYFTVKKDRHTVLHHWTLVDRLATGLAVTMLSYYTWWVMRTIMREALGVPVGLFSGVVACSTGAVLIESYLVLFECFSADCRAKRFGHISSDHIELLFGLLRLSTLLSSLSATDSSGCDTLLSATYLLEYYILMLSSHYSTQLPDYSPDLTSGRRCGVQQYTGLECRLLLGLLSVGRWSHLLPHSVVAVSGLVPRIAWAVVSRWDDDLSNLKRKAASDVTVRVLMFLWCCLIVSLVAVWYQVMAEMWSNSEVKVVYVCLLVVSRLTFVRMVDMSEAFQFTMIKLQYKDK